MQTGRKTRKEPALSTSGEINPKNWNCLRGLGAKNGRWDEILRDILDGQLKNCSNKKRADSDTDDDDDDDDNGEIPEETRTPIIYETSEKDGRHVSKRTNPDEDALQIHTDGEISGEISETQRGENKMFNEYYIFYRYSVEQAQGNTSTGDNRKTLGLFPRICHTTRTLKPNLKMPRDKRIEREMFYSVHSGSLTSTEFPFTNCFLTYQEMLTNKLKIS